MIIDSIKDFEYFKGMNNNFDEKPIINIADERTSTYIVGTDIGGEAPKIALNETIKKGQVVTVCGKLPSKKNLAKVVEGSSVTKSSNPDGSYPITINVEITDEKTIKLKKHSWKIYLATLRMV